MPTSSCRPSSGTRTERYSVHSSEGVVWLIYTRWSLSFQAVRTNTTPMIHVAEAECDFIFSECASWFLSVSCGDLAKNNKGTLVFCNSGILEKRSKSGQRLRLYFRLSNSWRSHAGRTMMSLFDHLMLEGEQSTDF